MNQFQALVIDDEPQVREFVSTILTNDGWQVAQSESAEEAFNMLNDEAWSVVFCDVMLGGADGYSVLRRFKEELPETKVVLMTGHGTAVGALDATAFGAYDYLLKPFGPEEVGSLATALREQLSEKTRVLSPKHHAGKTHHPGIACAFAAIRRSNACDPEVEPAPDPDRNPARPARRSVVNADAPRSPRFKLRTGVVDHHSL